MSDEEIVKALKICTGQNEDAPHTCIGCPYFDFPYDCVPAILSDAFDYINRLKEKIDDKKK